jgi:hypothetical protein
MPIVRFNEFNRYDIRQDKEVVCFTGHTPKGTFHTEQHCPTSRHLRETREKFREKVIELIESGEAPKEIQL